MSSNGTRPLWKKVVGGTFYAMILALAAGLGMFLFFSNKSSVMEAVVRQGITKKKPQEVFDNSNVLTMLILGCDEDRYYGGKQILSSSARSDMMLLARLDFEKKRITGVSIPRDLLVDMPGYRPMKINSFHALGGKDKSKGRLLAQQAVEYTLGVKIDRVVEINFEAFKEMIDLVGGVEVFVDKPLHYDDFRGNLHIHLDPGRQVLTGEQAMGYVRYRHSDSDFKRQERQKNLMYSFKDKAMHSPGRMADVAEKVIDLFNREFDAEEVASLALFARSIGNDNIKMGQVPVIELPRKYYLGLDYDKLPETMTKYNFAEANPSHQMYGMDR